MNNQNNFYDRGGPSRGRPRFAHNNPTPRHPHQGPRRPYGPVPNSIGFQQPRGPRLGALPPTPNTHTEPLLRSPPPPLPMLIPIKIITFMAPDHFTVLSDSLSDSLYQDLQLGLGREWNKASGNFAPDFLPICNMHVIYKESPNDPFGKRAIVEQIPTPKFPNSYRIFLYDEGIYWNCELKQIKPMDISWFLKLQSRSLVFTIPGLIPLNHVNHGRRGSDNSSLAPAPMWSKRAMSFAREWFNYGQTAIHLIKHCGDVAVYGDIHISNDPKPLSKHLTEMKYASASQTRLDLQLQISSNTTSLRMEDGNMNQSQFQQPRPAQNGNFALPNPSAGLSSTSALPHPNTSNVTIVTNKGSLPDRPTYSKSKETQRSISNVSPELSTSSWRTRTKTQTQNNSNECAPEQITNVEIVPCTKTPELPSDNVISKTDATVNKSGNQVQVKPSEPDVGVNSSPLLVFEAKSEYCRIKVKVPPKKTFMRGNDILPAVVDFGTMDLPAQIKNALLSELEISQLNSLQRHVWPQLFQGRHCTIIGGSNNQKGKTLSYLVPLVAQSITFDDEFKKKNNGKSSLIALIIVANSKSGAKVYNHLVKLTSEYPISTIYISTPEPTQEQYNEVQEGVAIMVAIPECLEYFSLRPKDFFVLPNLKILAIDDSHITLVKNLQLVLLPVRRIAINSQKLGHSQSQIITCGKEWNTEVSNFTAKILEDPILIIGNPVQAVVFGRVKFTIFEPTKIPTEQRVAELVKQLQTSRILILCNNEIGVIGLCSTIYRRTGISVVPITDEIRSSKQSLQDLADMWDDCSGDKKLVFIATAAALNDLPIHNANILIHYQINYKNAEAFWNRHAAMWDLFPKLENYSLFAEPENCGFSLASYIFVETEDEKYFKIVQKFKELKVEIPENLSKSSEKLSIEAQEHLELCETMMCQGECNNPDCRFRHGFLDDEILREPTTPKTGGIEVEIIESLDVNKYLVKLIKSYDYDECNGVKNVHNYVEEFENLNVLLKEYYGKPENLKTILTPEVNVECVAEYKSASSGFARCRIILVYANSSIRVFCYDYGKYMVRKAGQLYQIPRSFSEKKPYCVELILAKLKPSYSGVGFASSSKLEATKLIGTKFTGRICLAMGNKVWVSYLYLYKKSKTGFWVKEKDVAGEFFTQNIAEKNPGHMLNLYKTLQNFGMDCSLYLSETHGDKTSKDTHLETESQSKQEVDEVDNLFLQTREENLKKSDKNVDNVLKSNGADECSVSESEDAEGFSVYMDEASAKKIIEKVGLKQPGSDLAESSLRSAKDLKDEPAFPVVKTTEKIWDLTTIGAFDPCHKKPRVEWSQNKSSITLRVHILDLKTYDIKYDLDQCSVSFQSVDPPDYSFDLVLYGLFLAPAASETLTGQYLNLKITKLSKNYIWPWITKEKIRVHWLQGLKDESLRDEDDEFSNPYGSEEDSDDNKRGEKNALVGPEVEYLLGGIDDELDDGLSLSDDDYEDESSSDSDTSLQG